MCNLVISCLPALGFTNASGLAKLSFLFDNGVSNSFHVYIEREGDFNWFFDNEHIVRTESFPLPQDMSKSVASNIGCLFDNLTDDDNSDELYEIIYQYRERHCFRFGFRGQDVPDVYLASKSGKLEISCEESDIQFNYLIEFEAFYQQLKNALKKYRNLSFPDS
ncbi:hypothetical protein SAMN05444141_1202 [Pseudovibrio denitrificans]|uniref:Immunity protein 42 n=1 Tax=Pseudovibrio denitrificans TaxID=258256 RepID=A0A1I7E0M3_9HYPH|nr:hypothetical protein [Pseudovibrio denitrificans]SFU17403.1 hypothetical protein SAMN05444141_1202 [Pseudovibrio denitrificans]